MVKSALNVELLESVFVIVAILNLPFPPQMTLIAIKTNHPHPIVLNRKVLFGSLTEKESFLLIIVRPLFVDRLNL